MNQRLNQQGTMNVLVVPVIALTLLFIAAGSFAVWAYAGRQDYKSHTDEKIAEAVQANTKVVQAKDAADYAEAAKQPLKPYTGPDSFGSVKVLYPKTWGAYVDTQTYPLDVYFHNDFVPSTQLRDSTYNLRVRVEDNTYSRVMDSYKNRITQNGVTAVPYSLPKVPKVAGTRLSGAIFPNNQNGVGDIILLPLRDKTLEIWTESPTYLTDFNTYILPNLTFSP